MWLSLHAAQSDIGYDNQKALNMQDTYGGDATNTSESNHTQRFETDALITVKTAIFWLNEIKLIKVHS